MTLNDLIDEKIIISSFDILEEKINIILNEQSIPGCGILLTTTFLDDILELPREHRKEAFEEKMRSKGYDKRIKDLSCRNALYRIKSRLDKFDKNDIDKIIALPKDYNFQPTIKPIKLHPACEKTNLKKIADNLRKMSLEIKDIILANPSLISQSNARIFSNIAFKSNIKESTEIIKALEQNCDNLQDANNLLKYIHIFRSAIMNIIKDLKRYIDKDHRNETSNKAKSMVKMIVNRVQQFS